MDHLYYSRDISMSEANMLVDALNCKEADLAAAQAERDALRDVLCMLYDKYEDGPGCQEGFDGEGGYIGNAVMLSKEEEDSILALIPKERDAAIDAARGGND